MKWRCYASSEVLLTWQCSLFNVSFYGNVSSYVTNIILHFPFYTADERWLVLSFKLNDDLMFLVFQIMTKLFFFCKTFQFFDKSQWWGFVFAEWLTPKGAKPYFQLGSLSEILPIKNLRQATSRIWTCAEAEFRLYWRKLCSSDNSIIITLLVKLIDKNVS